MNIGGIGATGYPVTGNVSTNKYSKSRAGQFYPQKQAAEASVPKSARRNANVQGIYEALKSTDPKYTDKETGFSWYVRDGKHPYMTGEDAAKFKEMCKETGESWLKKFAEMTGTTLIAHIGRRIFGKL